MRLAFIIFRRSFVSFRTYVFPELKEKELEEYYVHGSGPGGQKVNTANNCVHLKHIPTGLFVKVHDSRSVIKNREIARQRLRMLLDDRINGENSFRAQTEREQREITERKQVERQKRRELKGSFKRLLENEKNPTKLKMTESDTENVRD